MLNAAELSSTALINSSLGTSVGTMLWRTGSVNAQAIAVISVKANKCQTATSFSATRKPIATVVVIRTYCVAVRIFLRSVRSATTPAIGLAIRKGKARSPFSAPRSTEEPVKS